MKRLVFLVLAALSLTAGTAQARSNEPVIDHEGELIATGSGKQIDLQTFKKAVADAVEANSRKWRLAQGTDGKTLQASMAWKKHVITVNIVPGDTTYAVLYAGSENMRYESVNGVRQIHPYYNKYVGELITSIRYELSKL